MRQRCMQVITCKARIKYEALLNVLFYKWLSYPAGISGWHWAAVTTAISNLRMSEHRGLSSKVKCQMLSIPTHREGPGPCQGLGGPASELVTEKHHYWARFALKHDCCHDCTMTTILTSVYLFYIWPGIAPGHAFIQCLTTEQETSNTFGHATIFKDCGGCTY